ncbi:MAG: hypothetical protein Q9218_006468, partial [Villophora microphyllina]
MADGESMLDSSHLATERAVPLRIWHCTHPRTASNLLAKQFQGHPRLAPKGYTFFDAYLFGPENLKVAATKSKKPGADKATYQNAFNELQHSLQDVEQK